MPDRKSLVFTLWLIVSLALLASVPIAPVRTSGSAIDSSLPECLDRNFALDPDHPSTRLAAAPITDAVSQVSDLPFEDEEQERTDVLGEPRLSFLIPRSFRMAHDRQLIAPLSILSLYPLRC